MIESKEDYIFYLEADRVVLGIDRQWPRFLGDEIWKFQRSLRKVEFLENCEKNFMNRVSCLYARYCLEKMSIKLGFTIPRNVFGSGLSIEHRGSIVIHYGVKICENCRIHQGVTIGSDLIHGKFPKLGNNIIIGPGAVIVGAIEIADGIVIGANSFVNKSFTEPNITVAGCPARKISDKGSINYWIRPTEIVRRRIRSLNLQ